MSTAFPGTGRGTFSGEIGRILGDPEFDIRGAHKSFYVQFEESPSRLYVRILSDEAEATKISVISDPADATRIAVILSHSGEIATYRASKPFNLGSRQLYENKERLKDTDPKYLLVFEK